MAKLMASSPDRFQQFVRDIYALVHAVEQRSKYPSAKVSISAGALVEKGLWERACHVLNLDEAILEDESFDEDSMVEMSMKQAQQIGVVD